MYREKSKKIFIKKVIPYMHGKYMYVPCIF